MQASVHLLPANFLYIPRGWPSVFHQNKINPLIQHTQDTRQMQLTRSTQDKSPPTNKNEKSLQDLFLHLNLPF
jgi:hypothetical protein